MDIDTFLRSTARAVGALALVAAAATPCALPAASPSLGSIAPNGAQRGGEVEVHFNGARLADAQEILYYGPGVTTVSLEPGENSVKARLAISPDCRLGQHAMRVRTASGLSELRTFYVGALKEVSEVEPNNDFAAPQQAELDSTINGVVQNEDVDYFVVAVKKGERLTAEVEGIRLGYTFFDPYVAILDRERFELASSDDAALVWQDGVASISAPEDGQYVIQIRETAYGGSDSCAYRLHVGRFPRPRAVVPAGGKAGESIEVEWLGDAAGPRRETLEIPTAPGRMFGLFAQDEQGIAPSPNVFRVSDLPNVLEAEPNGDGAAANSCVTPAALAGVIAEPGDVDCFKFKAAKGQQFDVRVLARTIRSPLDPVLNINRIGGAGVAGNDDSGGPDAYIRLTVPEDDEYVLIVQDHLGKGGPAYAYRIEVTPIAPALTMGLPERQQFVDVVTPIPQGNRVAVLVSASRADFGGELKIDVADLPAGVAIETDVMPANQSTVPVLLTAAADAPLSGALADVIGRPVDENLRIEGRLGQTTSMVRGQNNIQVWTYTADRMATAVTQAVPYSIEIVEPKAPLVQSGSMDLLIRATRQEGFTAPINISLLYNPPGVGAPGTVTIAEGQNEVILPLTANDSAEVRDWKIAVLGTATVGNGNVTVSSQLAKLTVASPFVALAFNAAAVEKGQETEVVVGVTKNVDFSGEASIELLGLPHEVTAEPMKFTPETGELVFKVKTTANSPVGKHKTLLCRAVLTVENEPVTHMLGSGELRIDEPAPPKASEPAPAAAAAAPMPEEKPPERRLTRLEQLRLEREQARKAAAAAQQPSTNEANETAAPAAGDGQAPAPAGD